MMRAIVEDPQAKPLLRNVVQLIQNERDRNKPGKKIVAIEIIYVDEDESIHHLGGVTGRLRGLQLLIKGLKGYLERFEAQLVLEVIKHENREDRGN